MTDKRKLEIFDNLIDLIADCDREICIDRLIELGITRNEAESLQFDDFILDALPLEY